MNCLIKNLLPIDYVSFVLSSFNHTCRYFLFLLALAVTLYLTHYQYLGKNVKFISEGLGFFFLRVTCECHNFMLNLKKNLNCQ